MWEIQQLSWTTIAEMDRWEIETRGKQKYHPSKKQATNKQKKQAKQTRKILSDIILLK